MEIGVNVPHFRLALLHPWNKSMMRSPKFMILFPFGGSSIANGTEEREALSSKKAFEPLVYLVVVPV